MPESESVFPFLDVGGAGISMAGQGAVASGTSPPPSPKMIVSPESAIPSLVSPSGADSSDIRVGDFPLLPVVKLHKDRVCPPLVAPDFAFPSKIWIGSDSNSPSTVEPAIEIHVSYPWKPNRNNSVPPVSIGSPKQPLAVPAPRGCLESVVPDSGIDCASGHSEAEKPRVSGIESSSLVVPGVDSFLHTHHPVSHLESNMLPVSYADSLRCGLGFPPLVAVESPKVDSVERSSVESPSKALEKDPFLKAVRFAPEILSAEASSSAPHCRMLALCSDILFWVSK
ncbi:hypothetical protein Nepgr_033783 [Nepenthes gracilis]|uniref:Uncharacterized protein n=1 Tax=Nepenthes gracilis TaxID=150966 RepID=A0AAD3TMN8_NEPGR|nr:hypothetical protein Nepgr_033783 [Nepenthes gracilis]